MSGCRKQAVPHTTSCDRKTVAETVVRVCMHEATHAQHTSEATIAFNGRKFGSRLIKPPPPVGAGGGYYVFGSSVRAAVRPCVRPSAIHVVVLFPRYLQYLLTDYRQTFVTGASRDRDELITFWGQKVKGQGHSMTE